MTTFTSNGTPITQPSPQYDIPIVCNNGAVKAFKTLNISTYDTSASDAGIDITFDGATDRRRWNTLNDSGTGTRHYENGFVSIYMDTSGNTYYAKALANGIVYGGSVYNTGEQIYSWNYNIDKNIDIYCPAINTDGTQEVVTDSLGNTANAERLLAVGDYKDTQEIISGTITRNCKIFVFNGTENWYTWSTLGYYCDFVNAGAKTGAKVLCTISTSWNFTSINRLLCSVSQATFPTLEDWKQYLSEQYQAGTPVIVVYPLAEPTTETVTGQPLTTQAGTNVVEITQSAIDNLGLEVSYKATV